MYFTDFLFFLNRLEASPVQSLSSFPINTGHGLGRRTMDDDGRRNRNTHREGEQGLNGTRILGSKRMSKSVKSKETSKI